MASTTDIIVETGGPAASPVNWGAVIAGALVATAATLILMLLGSGLGLGMISPWSGTSASPTALLASAAIWLVIVQWVASCMGGYVAGRMRTRWTSVHADEVVFRDTVHGLLAWALATLLVVGVLGSVLSAAVGTGVKAASTIVSGAAMGASAGATASADEGTANSATAYFVDSLFRPADPARLGAPGAEGDAAATAQAARILLASAAAGQMPDEDKTYLSQLVAARTGLSQADAEARVDAVLTRVEDAGTRAAEAAETARKASATTALAGALTLLIGAFIAAVSAALGGKLRDEDEDRWMRSPV